MGIYPCDKNDFVTVQKTIYAEARGEPHEGQVAVAHVIINRAKANRGYWGGSKLENVCRHSGQFECWNGKSDIDVSGEPRVFSSIGELFTGVLEKRYPDNTEGSDHYYNPEKEQREPDWLK